MQQTTRNNRLIASVLGRITKHWANVNKQLMKKDKNMKIDETQWAAKLFNNFWEMIFDIWTERNGTEHGSTTAISLAE